MYIFSFCFLLGIISHAFSCEACQWLEFPLNGFRAQSRVNLVVALLPVTSGQVCSSVPSETFKLPWIGCHCLVRGNTVYIPEEDEDDFCVGEATIFRIATPCTPKWWLNVQKGWTVKLCIVITQFVYVFRMIHTINRNYLPVQHTQVRLYNWNTLCSLWGMSIISCCKLSFHVDR